MSSTPDSQTLFSRVPADGTAIGNMKLRELLGWDEERYLAARQPLIEQGLLVTGRGKGGAVMRNGIQPAVSPTSSSTTASAGLEMFAEADISSSSPVKPSAPKKEKLAPISGTAVTNYQFPTATRKNIPPAGLATKNSVQETNPHLLAYDPHLSPVLRFDSTSQTDHLLLHIQDILDKAKTGPLTPEETQILSDALLRSRQPWLEWAGKREKRWFEVDPVALHIHERVSANAILKAAQRQDIEHDLFADPKLSREEALQFYKHDVDWANRLILGDSLQVMSSLARREGLAGKVQMIYIDPPYGIKFSSNWQNEVGKRDVKDSNEDLTREPEMIKAYRDTWTLGVHSYLDYLKQRLIVARELLTDSGSVFVQISDENLHRVRAVMDEVFGAENFVRVICFRKTGAQPSNIPAANFDFILWYARNRESVKAKPLFTPKTESGSFVGQRLYLEYPNGYRANPSKEELASFPEHPEAAFLRSKAMQGAGASGNTDQYSYQNREFRPESHKHWSTTPDGIKRLDRANRLMPAGKALEFVWQFNDAPYGLITAHWVDTVCS